MSSGMVVSARRDNAIESLMNARSVAVIGASDDPTRISGRPLRFLLNSGFTGAVYPVNPSRTQVQGVRCYSSVAQLPEVPDVAVLAVPAAATVGVVAECARLGVGVAVVTAGGFAETGESGKQLQEEMRLVARDGGLRVLGPNCLGAFNAHTGMYATFSQTLVSRFPTPGPVAIVSQSGAYGSHLGYLAQQRNLDIGYWITTGNEVDIDVAEALDWMVACPDVKVVMVYVEGVRNGATFRAALERARAEKKPVIVLKTGHSEAGARMAGSHTGALAGADEVYNAVLRAAGAYRASTIEEQLDIAYACTHAESTRVERLGVVTVSGGIGAHICDAADQYGLTMPALPVSVQRDLLELIPYATVANPIDCTGQALQDTRLTSAAFAALIDEGNCDAVLGFYSTVPSADIFAERLYEAMKSGTAGRRHVPLVICMVAKPETIRRYEDSGVLVFEDPDRAVRAIAGLSHFARAFGSPHDVHRLPGSAERPLEHRAYSEVESKQILADAGVPVLSERLARTEDEAAAAAQSLGMPVAVKIVSPDITHKSDIGAVVLDLHDVDSVRRAYRDVLSRAAEARPDAVIEGALVSPMAAPGIELIVGAKVDPVFGPIVMVGLGGVYVEILSDVALRLAPIDTDEAASMLEELKGASLLTGARGREPADTAAAAECLVAVSQFIAEFRDDLSVVEINPLLVYPTGHGVLAVDAVLITGNSQAAHQSVKETIG